MADFTKAVAAIAADNRRHAEEEWPGEGLNAVARAIFITRGGHAVGQSCALPPPARPMVLCEFDECVERGHDIGTCERLRCYCLPGAGG